MPAFHRPYSCCRLREACLCGRPTPHGRWLVRPLHSAHLDYWSPATKCFEAVLLALPNQSFAPCWTIIFLPVTGIPFHEPIPDVLLFMDAYESAWRARLLIYFAAGVWFLAERRLHSNVFEFSAVLVPSCPSTIIATVTIFSSPNRHD